MSAAESQGGTPYITIERETRPVNVLFGDVIVATTNEALVLKEGSRPPVVYVPRDHVATEFFIPTDHRTTCPHKGEARYWTISAAGRASENAAWAYDTPKAEAAAIAGHVAFYPDRLRIEVG
ncbi:hypothetical protein ASG43_17065 [Aureimonas sp. Leaf454]|uniref:DUF427 domain-containing protein n=1 Tax=Aureimonas sp. Leaf454 TaxID=1736381 RepID=UPI0006F6EFB0|nr:DUF427 domain-containing protein [Aureimonas sp. Leaf454]KQT41993.1 hypothetical protein ASG43_17065 [Aureimonas sp. Leaf454]